jgi:acetyl-CoA carboxylase biotin carboxyl carrier protein
VDVKELKRLLEAVEASGVSEFSLETDQYKISLKRGPNGMSSALAATAPAPPPGPATAGAVPESQPDGVAPTRSLVEVNAPIVGTFYRAPAPDQPPHVNVGDKVKPGQILCIIEAMKLMNEIEAEVAGTIHEILVQNEEPVEYGQVLFRIEPA